jgi:hypothetical protein
MELTWRKSSRSNASGGNCVEVAACAGRVLVRDSTNPSGPRLTIDPPSFRTFLTATRSGTLDVP